MQLTFEPLEKYVRQIDERNTGLITETVLGVNIDKYFMPSVANVIGTDLTNYKLLRNGCFACNPMHVGRDGRLPVALYSDDIPAIVSPAYFVFEIIDKSVIEPAYLMLCFKRPDFDRMCWFSNPGSGILLYFRKDSLHLSNFLSLTVPMRNLLYQTPRQ